MQADGAELAREPQSPLTIALHGLLHAGGGLREMPAWAWRGRRGSESPEFSASEAEGKWGHGLAQAGCTAETDVASGKPLRLSGPLLPPQAWANSHPPLLPTLAPNSPTVAGCRNTKACLARGPATAALRLLHLRYVLLDGSRKQRATGAQDRPARPKVPALCWDGPHGPTGRMLRGAWQYPGLQS